VTSVEFHITVLLCALAVVITVTYFAQLEFGRIPLVYMFTHPNESITAAAAGRILQALRSALEQRLVVVMFYGFLFLRTLLYPFLILVTWGYYLCTRERRWLLLASGRWRSAACTPRRQSHGRRWRPSSCG
jgi:hypothetical protein